jgi:hypothetical protein
MFLSDRGGNPHEFDSTAPDGGVLLNVMLGTTGLVISGTAAPADSVAMTLGGQTLAEDLTGRPAAYDPANPGTPITAPNNAGYVFLTFEELASLTFTPSAANVSGPITLQYIVYDGQRWSDPTTPATLTITITETNEAPTTTPAHASIAPEAVHVFTREDFGFSDNGDPHEPHLFHSITILSATPGLELNGLPVEVGTVVLAGFHIDNGRLTYNGDAGTGSFSYTINDAGNDANINTNNPAENADNASSAPTTFTVTVAAPLSPPEDVSVGIANYVRGANQANELEIHVIDPNHGGIRPTDPTASNFDALYTAYRAAQQRDFDVLDATGANTGAFRLGGPDGSKFSVHEGDDRSPVLRLNDGNLQAHYEVEITVTDPTGGVFTKTLYLTTIPLYVDGDGDTSTTLDRTHSGAIFIPENHDATGADGEINLGTLGATDQGLRGLFLAEYNAANNNNNQFRIENGELIYQGVAGTTSGNADIGDTLEVAVEYFAESIRLAVAQAGGAVPEGHTLYTSATANMQVLIDTDPSDGTGVNLTALTADNLVALSLYRGTTDEAIEIVSRISGFDETTDGTYKVWAVPDAGHWDLRAAGTAPNANSVELFDLTVTGATGGAAGAVAISVAEATGGIDAHRVASTKYVSNPLVTFDGIDTATEHVYRGDTTPGGGGTDYTYFKVNFDIFTPTPSEFIPWDQALTITIFNPDGTETVVRGAVGDPGDAQNYTVYATINNTIGRYLEGGTPPPDYALNLFTISEASSSRYQVSNIIEQTATTTFDRPASNRGTPIVEKTVTLLVRLEDESDAMPTVDVDPAAHTSTRDVAVTENSDTAAGGRIEIGDTDTSDAIKSLRVYVAADSTDGNPADPTQGSTEIAAGRTEVEGQYGTFTITRSSTGGLLEWSYELDDAKADQVGTTATEEDSLKVVVYDRGGEVSSVETITVEITGSNDAPIVRSGFSTGATRTINANRADDPLTTNVNEAATLPITFDISDVDVDDIAVGGGSITSNGIVFNTNSGDDVSVTYTLKDLAGGTSATDVTQSGQAISIAVGVTGGAVMGSSTHGGIVYNTDSATAGTVTITLKDVAAGASSTDVTQAAGESTVNIAVGVDAASTPEEFTTIGEIIYGTTDTTAVQIEVENNTDPLNVSGTTFSESGQVLTITVGVATAASAAAAGVSPAVQGMTFTGVAGATGTTPVTWTLGATTSETATVFDETTTPGTLTITVGTVGNNDAVMQADGTLTEQGITFTNTTATAYTVVFERTTTYTAGTAVATSAATSGTVITVTIGHDGSGTALTDTEFDTAAEAVADIGTTGLPTGVTIAGTEAATELAAAASQDLDAMTAASAETFRVKTVTELVAEIAAAIAGNTAAPTVVGAGFTGTIALLSAVAGTGGAVTAGNATVVAGTPQGMPTYEDIDDIITALTTAINNGGVNLLDSVALRQNGNGAAFLAPTAGTNLDVNAATAQGAAQHTLQDVIDAINAAAANLALLTGAELETVGTGGNAVTDGTGLAIAAGVAGSGTQHTLQQVIDAIELAITNNEVTGLTTVTLDPNAVGTTVVDATNSAAVTVPARVPGFSNLEVYAKASGEEGTIPDTPTFDAANPTAFAGTTIAASGNAIEVTGSYGIFSVVRTAAGQMSVTYQLFTAAQNQTVFDQFTALGETGRLYEKLTVYASDGDAGSRPFEYNVTINGVNDAPTDYTITGTVVSDNPVVGVLGAVDPDTSDTFGFTFRIAGGADAGSFRIVVDPVTNVSTLEFTGTRKDPGDPYELEITVTDRHGATSDPLALNLTEAAFYIEPASSSAPADRRFSSHQDDANNDGVLEGILAENAVADVDLGTLKSVLSPGEVLQLIDNTTADNGSFTTDATGKLTFNGSAQNSSGDFENGKTWTIVVGVGTALTAQETYVIRLSNVNDNAPDAVELDGTQVTLNEGVIADGTLTGYTVSSNDPDGGEVTWKIYDAATGGTEVTTFAIDADGNLVFNGEVTIDYETTQSTELHIAAVDSGVGSTGSGDNSESATRQLVTISYTDVNEHAPTAVTISSSVLTPRPASLAPDADILVGTLDATDQDLSQTSANDSFVFTLTGSGMHNNLFRIEGNQLFYTGEAAGRVTRGDEYELTIRVSDGVNTFDQTLMITDGGVFVDLDNDLSTTTDQNYSGSEVLPENSVASVASPVDIGTLGSATTSSTDTFIFDPNAGAGYNNDLFNIGTNNVLQFTGGAAGATVGDYEAPGIISYTIRVGVGTSFEDYVVRVSNVNEDPPTTPTVTGTASLAEGDVADGTETGVSVASTDPDGGPVTWKIYDAASGGNEVTNFRIDALTGNLVVNGVSGAAVPFDYETTQTISLYVAAVDSAGSGAAQESARSAEIRVTITGVNEADPVFDPNGTYTATVLDMAAENAVVGTVAATDADFGETATLTYSIVGDNRFKMVGDEIQRTDQGTIADGDTITLTIRATDTGTPSRSMTQSYVITVISNAPASAITAITETTANTDIDEHTGSEDSGTTETIMGTITFTDSDGAPHGNFEVVANGVVDNRFAVTGITSAGTGTFNANVVLRAGQKLDFETDTGTITLYVRVQGATPEVRSPSANNITVTVNDEVEITSAPTGDVALQNGTDYSGSGDARVLGTVEADKANTVFSLAFEAQDNRGTALTPSGTNAADFANAFTIDSSTGVVSYVGEEFTGFTFTGGTFSYVLLTVTATSDTDIDTAQFNVVPSVAGAPLTASFSGVDTTANGNNRYTTQDERAGGTLAYGDPDGPVANANVVFRVYFADGASATAPTFSATTGVALNTDTTSGPATTAGTRGSIVVSERDDTDGEITFTYISNTNSAAVETVYIYAYDKTAPTSYSAVAATETFTITESGQVYTPTVTTGTLPAGATTLSLGGRDVVSGTSDAEILQGGADRDTITTGGGGDIVIGGYGQDQITLGDGADTIIYRFSAHGTGDWRAEDGGDTINNFKVGEDKLVLIDVFNAINDQATLVDNQLELLFNFNENPAGTEITGMVVEFNSPGDPDGPGPRTGSESNTLTINFDSTTTIPVANVNPAAHTSGAIVDLNFLGQFIGGDEFIEVLTQDEFNASGITIL